MTSFPAAERRLFIATQGDYRDVHIYSGTPYFFADAARDLAAPLEALTLTATSPRVRARYERWFDKNETLPRQAFAPWLHERGIRRRWTDRLPDCRGHHILNFHQIFSKTAVKDSSIGKWCYIDQTLRQFCGYADVIDPEHPANRALFHWEKIGYESCEKVFCFNDYGRNSVIEDYGIAPERVRLVAPGANLAWRDVAPRIAARGPSESVESLKRRPLRFVFVGLDWRRKGLHLLIGGMEWARAQGADVTLTLIGPKPEHLDPAWTSHPWVDCKGKLSKMWDLDAFLDAVSACDIGVLLSDAEAAGLVILEYQLLGLGALVRDTGGSAQLVTEGCGITLPFNITPEDVGEAVLALWRAPERVAAMKEKARQSPESFSWRPAAVSIRDELQLGSKVADSLSGA